MSDLISGVLLIAVAYMGSGVFAIVLFRIFFPLKDTAVEKDTADENKLTFSYRNKADSTTKNRGHLLSTRERQGWVKVNS